MTFILVFVSTNCFSFQAADYEFGYGIQYAWNLVIFTMVISFSLTTPLIVPFGKEGRDSGNSISLPLQLSNTCDYLTTSFLHTVFLLAATYKEMTISKQLTPSNLRPLKCDHSSITG